MTTLRERVAARPRTIAVVAVPLLLVLAFAAATYTPLFHLRNVRVDGNAEVSRQRVLDLAGIGPGTNVFHLDAAAIVHALTADPWIATASVERHLPGSVVIRIQERTPVAQAFVGATPLALAGDGVVLPDAPVVGLPEVRASVGELSDDVRTGAARAVAALDPAVRARVSAVVAQPSGSLVMDLRGPLTVRYGSSGDDAAKAAALRAVLSWAADQSVTLRDVDLSVPGAPSATLADGSTVTP
jgi:cell division protein FtsQ